MSDEVKACPFCGKADTRLGEVFKRDTRTICNYCGAMGPSSGTEYDAAQYWQDRAPIPVEAAMEIKLAVDDAMSQAAFGSETAYTESKERAWKAFLTATGHRVEDL